MKVGDEEGRAEGFPLLSPLSFSCFLSSLRFFLLLLVPPFFFCSSFHRFFFFLFDPLTLHLLSLPLLPFLLLFLFFFCPLILSLHFLFFWFPLPILSTLLRNVLSTHVGMWGHNVPTIFFFDSFFFISSFFL